MGEQIMKNLSISIEILFKVPLLRFAGCSGYLIPYQYCTLTVTANTVDSILLMEEEDKTEKGHY